MAIQLFSPQGNQMPPEMMQALRKEQEQAQKVQGFINMVWEIYRTEVGGKEMTDDQLIEAFNQSVRRVELFKYGMGELMKARNGQ